MLNARQILTPGVAATGLMVLSVLAWYPAPTAVRHASHARQTVRPSPFHPVIETASFPPLEHPAAAPTASAAPVSSTAGGTASEPSPASSSPPAHGHGHPGHGPRVTSARSPLGTTAAPLLLVSLAP